MLTDMSSTSMLIGKSYIVTWLKNTLIKFWSFLGRPVYFGCFINVYHGGNVITRRLHSWIFLFVNDALINSFSKLQITVKLSLFGSELVALRIERGMIVKIRIKLKLFGVPLSGPEIYFVVTMGLWRTQSSLHPPFPRSTMQSTTTVCVRHPHL